MGCKVWGLGLGFGFRGLEFRGQGFKDQTLGSGFIGCRV